MRDCMFAVDSIQVGEFLQANFDERVTTVSLIGAGMFSQAFSFTVDQHALIFRLNASEEDFQKDAFAFQHFSAPTVPIPRLLRIGRFDNTRHFAITTRCPGQTLQAMDERAVRTLVPQLFQTMNAIHHTDVSGYTGWGLTDTTGHGRFASWNQYLLSFYDQKFAFAWPELIHQTFLEQEVYQTFFNAMKPLLAYCPTEKYLVHGDFGFDNVLSDGQHITGVLDWADARLGDFVYDLAYLDFWSKDIPYGALWQEEATASGNRVPHFEERMRCYMLHIGLQGLAIAELTANKPSYVRIRERTRAVLQPGRRSHGEG
jgi:hygromycin-B 4-O-kinase